MIGSLLLQLSVFSASADPPDDLHFQPWVSQRHLRSIVRPSKITVSRVDDLRERFLVIAADSKKHRKGALGEQWRIDVYTPVDTEPRASAFFTENNEIGDAKRIASLYSLIEVDQEKRIELLRKGELGSAATFDLAVTVLSCKGTKQCERDSDETHHETLALSVLAALDHSEWTLSIITSPGRFMGVFAPCRVATADLQGQVPQACETESRPQSVGATAAGSAVGAKIYFSPFKRYPWVGFSGAVRAASLGVTTLIGDQGDGPEVEGVLYQSPVDVSIGLADVRAPSPARFDITPEVGLAMLRRGQVLRTTPFFGVSISTPLIDVRGAAFNRKSSTTQVSRFDPSMQGLVAIEAQVDEQVARLKEHAPVSPLTANWKAEYTLPLVELKTELEAMHEMLRIYDETAPMELKRRHQAERARYDAPFSELDRRLEALRDEADTTKRGETASERLGLDAEQLEALLGTLAPAPDGPAEEVGDDGEGGTDVDKGGLVPASENDPSSSGPTFEEAMALAWKVADADIQVARLGDIRSADWSLEQTRELAKLHEQLDALQRELDQLYESTPDDSKRNETLDRLEVAQSAFEPYRTELTSRISKTLEDPNHDGSRLGCGVPCSDDVLQELRKIVELGP